MFARIPLYSRLLDTCSCVYTTLEFFSQISLADPLRRRIIRRVARVVACPAFSPVPKKRTGSSSSRALLFLVFRPPQTFWNCISPFLPARTAAKMNFLSTSKPDEVKQIFDAVRRFLHCHSSRLCLPWFCPLTVQLVFEV